MHVQDRIPPVVEKPYSQSERRIAQRRLRHQVRSSTAPIGPDPANSGLTAGKIPSFRQRQMIQSRPHFANAIDEAEKAPPGKPVIRFREYTGKFLWRSASPGDDHSVPGSCDPRWKAAEDNHPIRLAKESKSKRWNIQTAPNLA